VENTLAAIAAATAKVPHKWEGVQVSGLTHGSHLHSASLVAPFPLMHAGKFLMPAPSQAVFMKTAHSVALPIYQVLPDVASRIDQEHVKQPL
jgi:hypothetical protein